MATMGFIKSDKNRESKTSKIIVPETFTHSIAFGQTGCGKTTSFIYQQATFYIYRTLFN